MNASRVRSIRATRTAIALATVAVLAACASAPTVTPDARSQLAPTGKLRVGLLVTNPGFVAKDGAPGEMQGVGVEIGRTLAKELGVPFEPVRYRDVAALLGGATSGQWDVAPVGFSPERTANMDFTAPYLFGGSTYLVAAGSPIKTVADVDRAGYRIVAPPQSMQETWLKGNLRQAQLVSATGGPNLVASGKAHAWFATGPLARDWAEKRPELRVVEGSVPLGGSALAIAKGRPAGAAYAKEFIEHIKANGLIQQTIEQTGLQGVSVAPRAAAE